MISIIRPYSRNIQEFHIQKEYNSKLVIAKGKSDIMLRTLKALYLLKLFSEYNFPRLPISSFETSLKKIQYINKANR